MTGSKARLPPRWFIKTAWQVHRRIVRARSAVHPDRIEGIGALNEDREPTFQDPDY